MEKILKSPSINRSIGCSSSVSYGHSSAQPLIEYVLYCTRSLPTCEIRNCHDDILGANQVWGSGCRTLRFFTERSMTGYITTVCKHPMLHSLVTRTRGLDFFFFLRFFSCAFARSLLELRQLDFFIPLTTSQCTGPWRDSTYTEQI